MNELKRGDIVIRKRWYGWEKKIINAFFDGKMLVDYHLWNGEEYMIRYCQIVSKEGWTKITTI